MSGRGSVRQGVWSIADVGVSSLTNYIAVVAIARSVTADSFGAFALANLIFVLCTGLFRALTCEPLLIRHAASDREDIRAAARWSSGTSLALGLLASALLTVGAVALAKEEARSALLAVALVLPGLLVQDNLRFSMLGAKMARSATVNDLIWACTQGFFFVVFAINSRSDLFTLILVWGLSGNLAAIVGAYQMHLVPRVGAARRWFEVYGRLARGLAMDFLSMTIATQTILYVTGAIVGIAAMGALRGAQMLVGPVLVLVTGFRVVALSQGPRLRDTAYSRLPLATAGMAGTLVVIALIFLLVLVALPDSIGIGLLGDSWQGISELLPAVGIGTIGATVAAAPLFGLRVLSDARRTLRARRVDAPVTLALGLGGALGAGALGAAVGLALAKFIAAGFWWYEFWQSYRANERSEGASAFGGEFGVGDSAVRLDTQPPVS